MVENESVANHSAMGWAESIKRGVKTLAIVHGRVRDDVEKKMWMNNNNKMKKRSTNEDTTTKMKIKNEQHHKNHTGGSLKQSNIAGSFWLFKKMIAEVLLVPLYLILFFIWWQFRRLNKIMTSVGDILNDDDFFGDAVDTPKEGIEQHKKREELKNNIGKGKLGHKWTHKRVDQASDEIINKTYAEYKQRELNEKSEKTGKALGKHVINLYSPGISRWLKIKDVKKLQ